MFKSIIAASTFALTQGQFQTWEAGFCPTDPEPVGNFEADRYQGNWFEQYRDKDLWYEFNQDCTTASYFLYKDDPLDQYPIGVNNRKYVYATDTVTETRDPGMKRPFANARLDKDGKGAVKFRFFPEGKYIVIDTDYNNYAVVYNCDDWFFGFTRAVWLLSRTPRLSQNYVDAAKAVIERKVGKTSGSSNPYNLEG